MLGGGVKACVFGWPEIDGVFLSRIVFAVELHVEKQR